jgi:hypothetical protein
LKLLNLRAIDPFINDANVVDRGGDPIASAS